MKQILEQLRRTCPGIIGSILLSRDAKVLANDLPDLFSDCNLDDIARQVADIYMSFDDALPQRSGRFTFEDAVLKYDSLWCYCRLTSRGYLVIVADAGTDLAKIRGFSGMALKKIRNIQDAEPQRSHT